MSLDAIVDVGHGRRSDGTFDPGTIAADGVREHDQAHEVTKVVRAALTRSGVSFDSDDHGSGGLHDRNWSGTVERANRLRPKVVVEVHFDWNRAPRGGFGIHYPSSTAGKALAARIAAAYRSRGLPLRYDGTYADTRGLALLSRTSSPAVIWECDRVGAASRSELIAFGEAIAEGIASYVGERYAPPDGTTPTPTTEEDIVASIDDLRRVIQEELGLHTVTRGGAERRSSRVVTDSVFQAGWGRETVQTFEDRFTELWLTARMLASKDGGMSAEDREALARSIVDNLPDDLARQVLDGLHARLEA